MLSLTLVEEQFDNREQAEKIIFGSTEYQDHFNPLYREYHWYNGSLMGVSKGDPSLFGPHGRLRTLQSKITSQETSGSRTREQIYRYITNIFTEYFPLQVLDPLVHELLTLKGIRLPNTIEKAICLILGAVEMYLRKHKRTVIKEQVLEEIKENFGINISQKEILLARGYLARNGFWRDQQLEINTCTYDILRNLILEVITTYSFPVQDGVMEFRRCIFHRSNELITQLSDSSRRPQTLEAYAHAIVSLAVEDFLDCPFSFTKQVQSTKFIDQIHRAKAVLRDLKVKQEILSPEMILPEIDADSYREQLVTFLPKDQIVNFLELLWGNLYRMENNKVITFEEKVTSTYFLNCHSLVNDLFRLTTMEILCDNLMYQFENFLFFQGYFFDSGKGPPWLKKNGLPDTLIG